MKTINNIGFKSGMYDTRVTKRTKKQPDEQTDEQAPKSNKIPLMVPKDNEYIKALVKAFNQFIIDECTGAYSMRGFTDTFEAAKTLFPEEKQKIKMKNRNPFAQYTTYNTEVIFY